ncbi:Tryptophan synthase alpha chain [Minicystis rosea]|nr:Tryptophan synthase alpha chain [Minicystis rosea]
MQIACACPGDESGVQVCKADGSGYDTCSCASSSSGGAPIPCTPGAQIPCYSGPKGTEGVGICKAGVQTCNPNGMSYGACTGEVHPKPENCDTPEDESCDGSPGPCGGVTQWSKSFGQTGDDEVYGLAVDAEGRAAITGFFHGTIDFGGGPLSAGPTQAIFIAVYDEAGQHLWSKAFAGGQGALGQRVSFTAEGDLVLAAGCDADVDFGGGPLFGPTQAICLVKLDVAGNHLWSKRFDGGGPMGLAVDPAGNIVLGGFLNGDLGGGAISSSFLAKLDATAHFLWARQEVGMVEQIASDGAGNVFVNADIGTDVPFGGPQSVGQGTAVVKLSGATGAFASGLVASSLSMHPAAMGVDAQGNAFAAGSFAAPVQIGTTMLSSDVAHTGYLTKLDPAGNLIFAKAFRGKKGWAEHRAGAVLASGEVVLTGVMTGPFDFGNGVVSGSGLFVAKLDAAGSGLWAHVYDNPDYYGRTHPLVAVDGKGGVVVAGGFSGSLDFGKGVLASSQVGDQDIFIARLTP